MSSKRYLLILLLFACLDLLSAQPGFMLDSGFYLDDDLDLKVSNRIGVYGQFGSGFDWELESDLRRAVGQSGPRLHEYIHTAQAEVGHKSALGNFRVAYANTIYGEPELMGLYPAWMPVAVYKRLMAQQGYLSASSSHEAWSLDAGALYRYLRVEPWQLDFSDFQFYPQPRTGFADLYGDARLSWQAGQDLSFYAAVHLKAGFYDENDPYDYNAVKLGSDLHIKPWARGRLDAGFAVSHREGDAIDAPRANLVQTRLRYQHSLMPSLNGFITWENNTCFDDSLSALYLISNYLRPQLVYSLDYDGTGMSFLRLGAKYSPENDANAIFGDAEARIWKGLYAGLGYGNIPDRMEQYSSALLYRFWGSEAGLRYQHREFKIYPGKTDYWGVETRLYW